MQALPIDAHLPAIVARVRDEGALVLTAEPGAGKTTRVPSALLLAGLAEQGTILVLEPRRLAARLAARRVAEELGERAGERVGFQVRHDTCGGRDTRLWFVTEGVLTRRLLGDPRLTGVAAVVLDEFHERSLHADLALAWIDRLRRGERPDLRLVVMSATLDAGRVAEHMDLAGGAMHVPGSVHPVELIHATRRDERPLAARVASAVARALDAEDDGDVLVFLPGVGEIRRAHEALLPLAASRRLELRPLYGALPPEEQDRALAPCERRRVFLATNVAETSITIDGVRAVVDSGLARVLTYSPWSGLPSLDLAPISRASATQRAGRAGRTAPGRCERLYPRSDHDARPAADVPEILRADLCELRLTLHAMGVRGADEVRWLDAPAPAAWDAAGAVLRGLGALDDDGTPSALGRAIAEVPAHPRLARLAIEAARRGCAREGASLAAKIGERDEGAARAAAQAILRALPRANSAVAQGGCDEALAIATLAGFSDRLARRRAPGANEFVLAGGGAGRLDESCLVGDADLIAVVDAREGERRVARIAVSSAVDPVWLLEFFPERLRAEDAVVFDEASERVVARSTLRFDDLVIEETVRSDPRGPDADRALFEAARARGFEALCGDADALNRLRARRAFAAAHDPAVPLLDDAALLRVLEELCAGRRSLRDVRDADPLAACDAELEPKARAALAKLAPERVELPSGRRARIEYPEGASPFVASFLQDFFGMTEGPAIAGGRVPLVLHLLAPSRRPVQVTTDLAGFWARHYPALRRELMRRYPRHAWPEDPLGR